MGAVQVFILTVLLMAGYSQSVIVSQADEDRATNATREMIRRLEQESRIRNPTAKLIRLMFHDCITGCDGCVDLGNIDNNGLDGIYQEVNTLYDSQFASSGMSRADFIALQAVVAVRVAANEQVCNPPQPDNCVKPTPELFIRYGRKDCAISPNSTREEGLPNAHRGLAHVMDVFRDGMGMTEKQVVALIGAHTLGMTSPRNSGFQGPWAPPTNRLDNGFYSLLVAASSGWHQSELNFNIAPAGVNPRFQWDTGDVNRMPGGGPAPSGGKMMLNTDMALFKKIAPDSRGREMDDSCRNLFTNCPPSRTAAIVEEYAMNNTLWHLDFGPAFQILLENGYADNHLVAAGQELPVLVDPTVKTGRDSAFSVKGAILMVAVGAVISLLL